jgi:two-component system chemotaxis response regulator CheY
VGKRILAVDDSASVRQMQRFVLAGAGYDVIDAVDGKDGLAKLEKNGTVNLILTDLNMPNLDGVGFIKAVRASSAHRVTPIVVISTESQQEKKQEARAAGATGWIVKPFTPEQLLAVVKKVIG